MAAFRVKISAGMPDSGLLAALPSSLVILRPVPAQTITQAFLVPVRLSPSACGRLLHDSFFWVAPKSDMIAVVMQQL
jgi:hypothetical protein